MPQIGLIETADIVALGASDITDLCNELIWTELRRASLPINSADLTHEINHPDGGIDAWVSWEAGPGGLDFIPSRLTGYQFKSGEITPAAAGRELVNAADSDLKPRIKELFLRGGTYVLVVSKRDLSHHEKLPYIEKMRESVERFLGSGGYEFRVYGVADLKGHAQKWVPATAFVVRASGREHPSELKFVDEWASERAYQNEYVPIDRNVLIGTAIKAALRTKGQIFRLDGLPGLGKSRLALQSVRELQAEGYGAAYINVAERSLAERIRGMVINWKRHQTEGILIIDNCPAQLHELLAEEIEGSRLSVLTIDYNIKRTGPTGPYQELRRLEDDDDIRRIVRATYVAFDPMQLTRIVQYAHGWPLIALRLAKAVVEHRDEIASATDDLLVARLLGIVESDHESKRVISVLSLFEHVGFEEPYASHLPWIHEHLCDSVHRDRFYEIIDGFRSRGVVVVIGSLYRVTPPPVALNLAGRWLEAAPSDKRAQLFDASMPDGLVEFLCRQFSHLDTVPRARELAERLCEPAGPFGTADALETRRGARVFRSIAPLAPQTALLTLQQVLGSWDRERLLDYRDGRREVVWALEQLIYPAELFTQAASILAILASAENEAIANNSTAILSSRFAPVGSQTEASGTERLCFLDALIDQGGAEYVEVAAHCVQGGLAPDLLGAQTVVSPPTIGRTVVAWLPNEEEADAYRTALNARMLRILAKNVPSATSVILKTAERSVRWLARYRRYGELEAMLLEIAPFASRPWRGAIEQLQDALRYELRSEDADGTARLKQILEKLQPIDLPERAKLLISSPPPDFTPTASGFVDHADIRARAFAREVYATGQAREVLALISFGEQQRAIAFGEELASVAADSDDVVQWATDAVKAVPAHQRNIGALTGALAYIARTTRSRFDAYMSALVADLELTASVPTITAIVRPRDADITRLLPLIHTGAVNPEAFTAFGYGRSLEACSDETIFRLLDALLQVGAYAPTFFIANMQTVSEAPARFNVFAPYIKRALIGQRIVLNPMRSMEDWSALEDTRRLLQEPGHDEFAAALCHDALERGKRPDTPFAERERIAQFWPMLLRAYRDTVLNTIEEQFDSASRVERWWMLTSMQYVPAGAVEHRLALEELPLDKLMEFASKYPDVVPGFLAREGSLYAEENGELEPSLLLIRLLEQFGSRSDVRDQVGANLRSFLSVGARSPYLAARRNLLASLPAYADLGLRSWKTTLMAQFDQEYNEQRKRDEEFEGGAF